MKFNVIITAGGLSQRYGKKNKLFEKCKSSCVILEAVKPFLQFEEMSKLIIGIESSFADELTCALDAADIFDKRIALCIGGSTRTQTVKNAISAIEDDADIVLVHDGARPYVKTETIKGVIDGTLSKGVALPLLEMTDAIVRADGVYPAERSDFKRVQTPFGAKREIFLQAYQAADKAYYDDLSVIRQIYDGEVAVAPGDAENVKITYASDIKSEDGCKILTGCGYDIHRMTDGSGIKLLGVYVPCKYSFIAHSDGDVPIHAIMDAILSALGEKDIGHLFPVDDERYDNADSMELLSKVLQIARQAGYRVHNVTAAIIAQEPMLSPYIDAMRKRLADMLGLPIGRIGISATTNEGVGELGDCKAIAAYASVLLTGI